MKKKLISLLLAMALVLSAAVSAAAGRVTPGGMLREILDTGRAREIVLSAELGESLVRGKTMKVAASALRDLSFRLRTQGTADNGRQKLTLLASGHDVVYLTLDTADGQTLFNSDLMGDKRVFAATPGEIPALFRNIVLELQRRAKINDTLADILLTAIDKLAAAGGDGAIDLNFFGELAEDPDPTAFLARFLDGVREVDGEILTGVPADLPGAVRGFRVSMDRDQLRSLAQPVFEALESLTGAQDALDLPEDALGRKIDLTEISGLLEKAIRSIRDDVSVTWWLDGEDGFLRLEGSAFLDLSTGPADWTLRADNDGGVLKGTLVCSREPDRPVLAFTWDPLTAPDGGEPETVTAALTLDLTDRGLGVSDVTMTVERSASEAGDAATSAATIDFVNETDGRTVDLRADYTDTAGYNRKKKFVREQKLTLSVPDGPGALLTLKAQTTDADLLPALKAKELIRPGEMNDKEFNKLVSDIERSFRGIVLSLVFLMPGSVLELLFG